MFKDLVDKNSTSTCITKLMEKDRKYRKQPKFIFFKSSSYKKQPNTFYWKLVVKEHFFISLQHETTTPISRKYFKGKSDQIHSIGSSPRKSIISYSYSELNRTFRVGLFAKIVLSFVYITLVWMEFEYISAYTNGLVEWGGRGGRRRGTYLNLSLIFA